jgi:hypothetical protein
MSLGRMPTFNELLSEGAGIVAARQLALGDFLGEHNWNVDLETGRVSFGEGREYAIFLLGSESQVSGTWLWAWANEHIQPSEASMQFVQGLYAFGEEEGVTEFTEPSFPLETAGPHQLGIAACLLAEENLCYYVGGYDGGAVLFLVEGLPEGIFAPSPLERVNTVLMTVISNFAVDHLRMTESFLENEGFDLEQTATGLVAYRGDGQLTVTFDDQGRIAGIEATIQG